MALMGPCERCGRMHTSYGGSINKKGGHYCDSCYNKYYTPEAKRRIKREKQFKKLNKKWWQFWL